MPKMVRYLEARVDLAVSLRVVGRAGVGPILVRVD
jgi:hypothetical protein